MEADPLLERSLERLELSAGEAWALYDEHLAAPNPSQEWCEESWRLLEKCTEAEGLLRDVRARIAQSLCTLNWAP
jgi:hypothetical protein